MGRINRFSVKRLPNDISAFRIAGSIGLLFCNVSGWPFWTLYVLCGFSDMADGWLARKLHAETEAGAIWDSVADIVFVACCATRLLPVLEIPAWLWIWAGAIVIIKMVNQISALFVFKRFCFPHTWANKLTGFLLFLTVPTMFWSMIPISIVAAISTFAAVQEGHYIRTKHFFLTFLLTRTLRHVLSLPANNKSARIVMGKNKLKIGEFSRLGRVTVRALRHFEEIDLLTPEIVDRDTGYRYYSVGQLQKIFSITKLKSMGYSLEEIRDLWDEDQHFPTVESLEEKIRKCEDELAVLKERKRMLKAVVASQKKLHKMEKVYFESLPAITVASHRTIIPSFEDLGRLCCEVIGPEMARLGCECPEPGYCYTIEHGGYKPQDIDIEYCEKVTKKGTDSALIKFKDIPAVPQAACLKVFGPYEKLYDNYVELFAYLEKEGYKIADAPRAVYIDGIWNQEDPDKWLTIIQVPVEKA